VPILEDDQSKAMNKAIAADLKAAMRLVTCCVRAITSSRSLIVSC
jgi:hypothetical protein